MIQPTQKERDVLRTLSGRMRALAETPEMERRRERIRRHHALLEKGNPLIICHYHGQPQELVPEQELQCENPLLRGWERGLRLQLFRQEHIRDDWAVSPFFNFGWKINRGNYGTPTDYQHAESGDSFGNSYHWTPLLDDIERDFHKLREPVYTVDREGTLAELDLAQSLFGDLLPTRIRHRGFWTSGLTWDAILLMGLEELLVAPYEQPEGLARLLGWLRDQHLRFLNWQLDEKLLTPQNEDEHNHTGGPSYTNELPGPDWKPGDPVRLSDIWGFAESQETVGMSGEMFAEHVLPYQVEILEKFGLNSYGCCEPLDGRIDFIMERVPRLRHVGVSPWSDKRLMAEKLAGRYVYSQRPNPAHLCVGFNEAALREDTRATLQAAGDQPLEILMKDVRTVENEPRRLGRWVEIVREEIDRHAASRNS